MKRNKRQLYVMIFVFAMIALAYTCRMLDMYDIGSGYPGDVRAALYIVLLALWGYSIDRRIIQKPVTALSASDRCTDVALAYSSDT